MTFVDKDGLLRPLRSKTKRDPFAVVDIETKDGDTQDAGFTRPFLAGFYDGSSFVSFQGPDCISRMVAFLLDPSRDGWRFYAHFGGSFDYLHFLKHIIATGYYFEILTVSSSIQMLKVKRTKDAHDKGWMFLDSYKLIPIGLAKATKAFNVESPKMKFDLNTPDDHPGWGEYNRIDCVGLYQTLTRFYELVETQLGGEVGVTTASTAMRTFRRSFQKTPIYRHSRHHPFFREAYYGGRVERVMTECEGLRYYDFNSAYPYVMQVAMPIGKLYTSEGRPSAMTTGGGTRIGFGHVIVDYPEDIEFPVLPYRHQERLCFPVGHFSGVWTAKEIEAAEEQGATITWVKSVWIESGPVFGDMVTQLFKYRDKSRAGYDEGLAQTAKILLNSLYGKFGMNTLREKIIFLADDEDSPEGARPYNPKDPDCRLWFVKEEVDAPYIAPQIAAYITALSRLHLHSLIVEAASKGKVAYYDTDSVLTTADLSAKCNSRLGGLKDEGHGLTYRGVFLQPKLYSLEARTHDVVMLPIQSIMALSGCSQQEAGNWKELCGIPEAWVDVDGNKRTKESLLHKLVMKGYQKRDLASFNAIRMGEVISYKRLEKIGALARAGFKRGPEMRMVTRQLQNEDRKRIFEGVTSRPLVIHESEEGESYDEPDEDENE